VLPASIPRAIDRRALHEDPLGYLSQARSRLGDLVVVSDEGPIFSLDGECHGTVAAFGSANNHQVLTDSVSFGMPASAAQSMSLPKHVQNLNCGLHSKRGLGHSVQKRIVTTCLARAMAEREVSVAVGQCMGNWVHGSQVNLLEETRVVVRKVASELLLGRAQDSLATLLSRYFQLRREVASPFVSPAPRRILKLNRMASDLDSRLRRLIQEYRSHPVKEGACVLHHLAHAALSEDEIVGHINVLFISNTEPIAISTVWLLLLLTQAPRLQRHVRELVHSGELEFLDFVVCEALRVLTPNALMVRKTLKPVALGDVRLPIGCEVVVCPFLVHRDPATFPDPETFNPDRWLRGRARSLEYIPFGYGAHSCIGRDIALTLVRNLIGAIVVRADIALAVRQTIDWRIDVMLVPAIDPLIALRPTRPQNRSYPKWKGSVRELVRFAPGLC